MEGYVNPQNTTLIMDVVLNVSTTSLSETGDSGTTIGNAVRFQNNIQSIFQRVRVLYGGTVLEGIFVKLTFRYE